MIFNPSPDYNKKYGIRKYDIRRNMYRQHLSYEDIMHYGNFTFSSVLTLKTTINAPMWKWKYRDVLEFARLGLLEDAED